MNKKKSSRLALCGVLAALATALMFFGGVMPFAAIACGVLASAVLLPIYAEFGGKWGLLWYCAVTALALMVAPDKEAAMIFAAFGYYPVLHKVFGRLPAKPLKWGAKLLYLNASTTCAYLLMIFVLGMDQVAQDFADLGRVMLGGLLLLANVTFVVYDLLLDRLEIFYHVRLRPKLKL